MIIFYIFLSETLFTEKTPQCLLIFKGTGRNSKSVFTNLLRVTFPDLFGYVPETILTKSDSIPKNIALYLNKKKIGVCADIEDNMCINTAALKIVTGHDNIYYKEQEYKFPGILILHTNTLPKISSKDNGTMRRIPCYSI